MEHFLHVSYSGWVFRVSIFCPAESSLLNRFLGFYIIHAYYACSTIIIITSILSGPVGVESTNVAIHFSQDS